MPSPNELALQSDTPPKTKSVSQWLHDMGYRGGLHEFCINYGFKPFDSDEQDDARDLVEQFRDEQQEEWEARRRGKDSSSKSEKQVKNTTAGLSKEKKQEKIEQAMLWHQRMGHASYETILHLPKASRDFPTSFEGLEVRDLPACDICTKYDGRE